MARPEDDQPTRQPESGDHRVGPIDPAMLAVVALAMTASSWLGIDRFYGLFPELPWFPPGAFLGLAVVEVVAARRIKAWIDRREGARHIDPLLIARYVVLAKASAFAGAIFVGLYAGMTGWLFVQRAVLTFAGRDLPASVAGTVGSLALVVAALWLERACRVPPSTGDDSSRQDAPRPPTGDGA